MVSTGSGEETDELVSTEVEVEDAQKVRVE